MSQQLPSRLSGSALLSQGSMYRFENHWFDTMVAVKISDFKSTSSLTVMLAAFPVPGLGNSTNAEMMQMVWLCVIKVSMAIIV